MQRVTLTLQLVTPAFLGGADRREPAEWRGASVRGELRWWLRAVAWRKLGGEVDRTRDTEAAIFGSTDRASTLQVRALGSPEATKAGGVCGWGDRLDEKALSKAWRDESRETLARLRLTKGASNPIHYLAYGCVVWNKMERTVLFEHGYLETDQSLTLELQWRRPLVETHQALLRDALWCWLNLGGIGAKSRRGFGSLRCTAMEGDALGTLADLSPSGRSALLKQTREKLGEGSSAALSPDWSALSGRSRIFLGSPEKTWQDALMKAGAWMIAFRRRYGSAAHGHPGGSRDYEWAAPKGSLRGRGIPDRAGFGLPLPFGEGGETATWGSADQDGRRASPLLLHVARFGAADHPEYVPVLTFLPSRLIPAGELFLKKRPASGQAPSADPMAIVGTFLEDLVAKKLVTEIAR